MDSRHSGVGGPAMPAGRCVTVFIQNSPSKRHIRERNGQIARPPGRMTGRLMRASVAHGRQGIPGAEARDLSTRSVASLTVQRMSNRGNLKGRIQPSAKASR